MRLTTSTTGEQDLRAKRQLAVSGHPTTGTPQSQAVEYSPAVLPRTMGLGNRSCRQPIVAATLDSVDNDEIASRAIAP